jgi:hypothetical protein
MELDSNSSPRSSVSLPKIGQVWSLGLNYPFVYTCKHHGELHNTYANMTTKIKDDGCLEVFHVLHDGL